MKKVLVFIAWFCLIIGACTKSGDIATGGLPDLLPTQIDSWQRHRDVAVYNRETIFDYIDGAGEVYNSYAFKEVAVARYALENQPEVTVELFDMGVPDDAYGVFSYAREQEETGIGGGYEMRGGVLCFWQNRFYVCVTVERSDEQTGELLKSIAEAIYDILPRPSIRPPLVDALPADGLAPFSERFFHNQPSLNYHYYLARENILGLDSTTNAVLARYQPGSACLLLIAYRDSIVASVASESFRRSYLSASTNDGPVETQPGKYASVEQLGRYIAVVLDAINRQAADSLLAAACANLSHLK